MILQLAVFPELFWILPESAPLPTSYGFSSTQKRLQNTSYLQLGEINNWFYVVMTIFT